jgi:hypothetical protein
MIESKNLVSTSRLLIANFNQLDPAADDESALWSTVSLTRPCSTTNLNPLNASRSS